MSRGLNMPKIVFTKNIQRHVECPETIAQGDTVRQILDHVFAGNPRARGYFLDDQAALRKHVSIFVNGVLIRDRNNLSDPVAPDGTVFVFQALSGG